MSEFLTTEEQLAALNETMKQISNSLKKIVAAEELRLKKEGVLEQGEKIGNYI